MTDIEPPDRIDLLKRSTTFGGLDEESLEKLAQLGRWIKGPANSTLFHENERGNEMYVIGVGSVRIEKSTPHGPRFIAQRFESEVIGEMSVLDGRPRSATAVCESDCVLLSITKSEFVQCVRKHPSVALSMISNLMDRLREADARATQDLTLGVAGRLANYLLSEAQIVGERVIVKRKPSDDAIGKRIGCSRETVNRKLSELEAQNAILRIGKVVEIHDEEKLRELTGEI